jgi:hypothetical protein
VYVPGGIPHTAHELRGNPILDTIQRSYQLNWRSLLARGTAWAAGAALTPEPVGHGGLHPSFSFGGNTIDNVTWLKPDLMAETRTIWVRGFVPDSEFLSRARSYSIDPGLLHFEQQWPMATK